MHQLLSSFDEYLRLERGRSLGTVNRYLTVAGELVDFLDGPSAEDRLAGATEADVRAFLRRAAATRDGSLSGFMWNQKLAAVRTLYRYLVRFNFAASNPAAGLNILEAEPRERVPLTLSEFAALLRRVEARPEPFRSRDRALLLVAFHSALRVSELHRLNLSHLDFQNRLIVNLKVKRKKYLVVPFPPQVAEALRQYLSVRARFNPAPDEQALFLSDRSTRLSVRQMQLLVSGYGEQAGIFRRISPHFLRHSSATAHALRGTQPWDVQRLLGHASLATTQRYIHPLNSLRSAVDALGSELEELLADPTFSSQSSAPRRGALPLSGSSLLTGGVDAFPMSSGHEVVTA